MFCSNRIIVIILSNLFYKISVLLKEEISYFFVCFINHIWGNNLEDFLSLNLSHFPLHKPSFLLKNNEKNTHSVELITVIRVIICSFQTQLH